MRLSCDQDDQQRDEKDVDGDENQRRLFVRADGGKPGQDNKGDYGNRKRSEDRQDSRQRQQFAPVGLHSAIRRRFGELSSAYRAHLTPGPIIAWPICNAMWRFRNI